MVGVQLYSFRNQLKEDVRGTIEKLSSWGVKIVEGGMNTYGMTPEDFNALLKEHQIQVVSVGASFEELRDEPQKVMARAKLFGATYVMCAWIPHEGDRFGLADIQNATDVFNRAGRMLKKKELHLVYHPHGYEFRPYGRGTLFDVMAKNADEFNFQMDVYWVVHGGEDPMVLFERYPDRFKSMHLKDMRIGTVGNHTGHGDVEDNVLLGTGMIDIKALSLKGQELGVDYYFIEDESSQSMQQVPQGLEYLKKEVFEL